MDPNANKSSATPVNPTPQLEPKVFDLSSINAANKSGGGSFFKKKPFIVGILSVAVLAVLVTLGVTFGIYQKALLPSPAEECKSVQLNNVQKSPAENNTASLTGTAVNNCSSPVTLYLTKSWCSTVGSTCGEHQSHEQLTIGPGESKDFSVSQKVGNNGTCGSAQVDAMFTATYNPNSGFPQEGTVSHLGSCQAVQACKNVTIADNSPVAPGVNKRLEVVIEPNSDGVSYNWTVETSGQPGKFSSTNGNITLWTPPENPTNGQTWTFKPNAKNSSGPLDSSSCVATASFGGTITPSPSPSPTPSVTPSVTPTPTSSTPTPTPSTPPSYRTCENNACVTKDGVGDSSCGIDADCLNKSHKECRNNACVEVSGAGANSCSSDASCQPAAVPPPIPESGNTALTIIGVVSGLAALGAALFLAL